MNKNQKFDKNFVDKIKNENNYKAILSLFSY